MQEKKNLMIFNTLWNESKGKDAFKLAVFLIVIGIIGLFVTILCAEIIQNELKKCTQKKTKRQLRRSKCCHDLSKQRLHLEVQETMFVIPIKAVDISTINSRETGIQIPPSYQELGNKNEGEKHIPLID